MEGFGAVGNMNSFVLGRKGLEGAESCQEAREETATAAPRRCTREVSPGWD